MKTLQSPEDEPNFNEEQAIATMKAREVGKLDEVDGRLSRSSRRTRDYVAKRDPLNFLPAERRVQDRMLDERRAIMGLIGRHG